LVTFFVALDKESDRPLADGSSGLSLVLTRRYSKRESNGKVKMDSSFRWKDDGDAGFGQSRQSYAPAVPATTALSLPAPRR